MKWWNRIVTILVFLAAAFAAVLGLWLPGRILKEQSEADYGSVEQVPEEYYSASDMAFARDASSKLDTYQRLQLVTGQWESTVREAASYEMELESYEAVNKAWENFSEWCELGFYPKEYSYSYGNWYTWDATPCKAVDATFGTYTAYYWCIRLVSYDNETSSLIYMLEDGTIFLTVVNVGSGYDFSGLCTIRESGALDGMEVSGSGWEEGRMWELLTFAGLSAAGWEEIDCFAVAKEEDAYVVAQEKSKDRYLLAVLPQGEL